MKVHELIDLLGSSHRIEPDDKVIGFVNKLLVIRRENEQTLVIDLVKGQIVSDITKHYTEGRKDEQSDNNGDAGS